MSLLSRTISALRKSWSPLAPAWPSDWMGSRGLRPGQGPVDLTALTGVQRSIAAITGGLAGAQVKVVEDLSTGGSRQVRDTRSARTLLGVQQDITGVIEDYLLSGSGFAELVNGQLVHIPRRFASLERKQGTNEQWLRVDPEFPDLGQFRHVAPGQYLHLRHTPSTSTVYGQSPLDRVAPGLAMAARLVLAGRDILENAAQPGALLVAPGGMRPEARDRLRQDFGKTFGGANAGKTAVLDFDVRFEKLPGSADLIHDGLVNLGRFGVGEISRAFGVPMSLLSELSDVNRATAAEEARQFAQFTLRPHADKIAHALTRLLLSDAEIARGLRVSWDLSDALLGFGQERAEYVSRLVNGGVISRNEGRNILGHPDIDGGEAIAVPVNTTPLDRWLEGPQEAPAPAPAAQPTRSYEAPVAPPTEPPPPAEVLDLKALRFERAMRPQKTSA